MKGRSPKTTGRHPARRPASRGGLGDAAVAFDAEDIALARLQAQLRKSEAIQDPPRPAPTVSRRVTLRLPGPLVERLRIRARRDGLTLSDLIGNAAERFLRSA
jgi:predicted DNA binding CopG/RHH family protein